MCGITGIFNLNGKKVDRRVLHAMDAAVSHRGPDDHGEMVERNVGLANRRLAIIDTSKAGHQPMSSQDGSLWISFNGEIFNYQEIKKGLVKKGYRFFSHTDTETILYGYKEYDESIVQKLLGQFAFCIWDKRKNLLFLARDQIGVNPLYYAKIGKMFLFASEVKAILASGLIQKDVDPQALHHYLSMFVVPAPLTIFQHIRSLLPGTTLTVSETGMKHKKYWQLPFYTLDKAILDQNTAVEAVRSTLDTVVSAAMISDVAVGAFLSGGIDSSTVVSLMSQKTSKRVKTFSLWAEGGEAFDERKFAKLVAGRFGTDHTECTVTEEEIEKELPKIVYHFDQPTGGSFEQYFISKHTANHVKVALSGLGGDELFAGYHSEIYRTKILAAFYNRLPDGLRNTFFRLLINLPFSNDTKKTIETADAFLRLPTVLKKRLFYYFAYQEEEKIKLYTKEFLSTFTPVKTESVFQNILEKVKTRSEIDQLSYLDLNTYTRDDLLLGTNLMSMAHGVEARVPFLDPRLVMLAAKIPSSLKYRNGTSKYILREAVKDLLPSEILKHKKVGFGLPRVRYMKGRLKKHIISALNKDTLRRRGIFDSSYISSLVDDFYADTSGKMLWKEHLRIWILFIFELWAREFLN